MNWTGSKLIESELDRKLYDFRAGSVRQSINVFLLGLMAQCLVNYGLTSEPDPLYHYFP